MSNVGLRIRALREREGLTLEALGEAIGRDKTAMSRIERGERNVRSSELEQIAQRLSVNVRDLLGMRPRADLLAVAYRQTQATDTDTRAALATVKRVLEVQQTVDELGIRRAEPAAGLEMPSVAAEANTEGQQAAAHVRAELGLGAAPVHDLVDLADELGVDVLQAPLPENISGLCVRSQTAALIAVNSEYTAGHQRFTLAHELGHFLLDRDHELVVDTQAHLHGDGGDIERRAHAFAAHLLMPPAGLEGHLAGRPVDEEAFADLLFAFDVSNAALRIQLRQLRLITASQEREFAADRYNPKPLAVRHGHLEQWRRNRHLQGATQAPRRLWTRALEAYTQGRLGAGLLAVLAGEDADELEQALAADGIEPDFSDLYPPSTAP